MFLLVLLFLNYLIVTVSLEARFLSAWFCFEWPFGAWCVFVCLFVCLLVFRFFATQQPDIKIVLVSARHTKTATTTRAPQQHGLRTRPRATQKPQHLWGSLGFFGKWRCNDCAPPTLYALRSTYGEHDERTPSCNAKRPPKMQCKTTPKMQCKTTPILQCKIRM